MDVVELKATVSIAGCVFSIVVGWIAYLVSRFLIDLVPSTLGLTQEDRVAMSFLAALTCLIVCVIELQDARSRVS